MRTRQPREGFARRKFPGACRPVSSGLSGAIRLLPILWIRVIHSVFDTNSALAIGNGKVSDAHCNPISSVGSFED